MNRTRRMLVAALAALGFALFSGTPLEAQEAKPKSVTLQGTLACLGCDLKKAHGAGAQCSLYGHKHALKTADGKYYTFLESQKSEPLIKGEKWHGKPIEVTGTIFPGTQVIEVTEYKVPEEKAAAADLTAQKVVVNVCPMSGKAAPDGTYGTSAVGNYEVHYCCPGCKPAFDKLSREEQEKKIAAALKKS